MTDHLRFSIADNIAKIVLDRPERMNAFTFGMIDAWAAALQQCRTDDGVKVIMVTGAGAAFCSGMLFGIRTANASSTTIFSL